MAENQSSFFLQTNSRTSQEIKLVDLKNHHDWLDKLDPNTNYWTVITYQGSPSTKHLVYDCKPKALIDLFYITQSDFFVVDKKYRWFTYFQVNGQTYKAKLFKSGKTLTPFEM